MNPRHPGAPSPAEPAPETMALRVTGAADRPVLVYLPGLHGDWTLNGGFRHALGGRLRFAELRYPRIPPASLDALATAADQALIGAGLTEGWVLAESFGSQVAWAWLARPRRFAARGLVLAGGFVRHPCPLGARFGRRVFARAPFAWVVRCLRCFVALAKLRERAAGVSRSELDEFVSRRTEADRAATVHRLGLIVDHDWRPTAAAVSLPVYYLTGLHDPIVPWPGVVRWLRRHCPGFRGWRLVPWSDHHVLGCAPRTAAEAILGWMNAPPAGAAPFPLEPSRPPRHDPRPNT